MRSAETALYDLIETDEDCVTVWWLLLQAIADPCRSTAKKQTKTTSHMLTSGGNARFTQKPRENEISLTNIRSSVIFGR